MTVITATEFVKLAYPGQRHPLDDFEKTVALHLQELGEPYDYEAWAFHFELRHGESGILEPAMFVPDFVLADDLVLECFSGHDKATLKRKKRKCSGLWRHGEKAFVLNPALWERFGCSNPAGLADLLQAIRAASSWDELSGGLYLSDAAPQLAVSA